MESTYLQWKRKIKKTMEKKVHSTQKPESLLHRVLLASSNKKDLVLDPFLGSGTTAVVAKKAWKIFLWNRER